MKKLVYHFIALFMGASGLYAQDCATGYCPSTIVVHHKIGDLSAASGDITYNVVKMTTTTVPTCWITQNLGAQNTPASLPEYGSGYIGWVYEPTRKQGYLASIAGMATAPTLISVAIGDTWSATNDPCTNALGGTWRIPTTTEYLAVLNLSYSAGIHPNLSPTYYYGGSNWVLATTAGNVGYYCAYGPATNATTWPAVFYNGTSWVTNGLNAANGNIMSAGTRCVKNM